jgi:hypothetical protein
MKIAFNPKTKTFKKLLQNLPPGIKKTQSQGLPYYNIFETKETHILFSHELKAILTKPLDKENHDSANKRDDLNSS